MFTCPTSLVHSYRKNKFRFRILSVYWVSCLAPFLGREPLRIFITQLYTDRITLFSWLLFESIFYNMTASEPHRLIGPHLPYLNYKVALCEVCSAFGLHIQESMNRNNNLPYKYGYYYYCYAHPFIHIIIYDDIIR